MNLSKAVPVEDRRVVMTKVVSYGRSTVLWKSFENWAPSWCRPRELHLVRENLVDSDPSIIPYKLVNRRFMTLYGIISGSLSANYSWARYTMNWNVFVWFIFITENIIRFYGKNNSIKRFKDVNWSFCILVCCNMSFNGNIQIVYNSSHHIGNVWALNLTISLKFQQICYEN